MTEDDMIPISALQHYLYCPRQWALIHIEQMWTESADTAQGRLLHKKADAPGIEQRNGVRVERALRLHHDDLGLIGVADVVEFHTQADGASVILPVEYNKGKPKRNRADEVQLCAQTLCLEFMTGSQISEGALFYGEVRRRHIVNMDGELRRLTLRLIEEVRETMRSGRTPAADYDSKRCDRCSLIDDCQVRCLSRKVSVAAWIDKQL